MLALLLIASLAWTSQLPAPSVRLSSSGHADRLVPVHAGTLTAAELWLATRMSLGPSSEACLPST